MIEIEGVYQKIVKNNNRRKIYNCIRKNRKITKLDLTRELDLSITTITSNVRALQAEGFVSESGFDDSTGGRKAQIVEFSPDAAFTIGVELKEKHARIALLNLDLAVTDEEYVPALDTGNLCGECIRIAKAFCEKHADRRILGIGISLPGVVDVERWVLINAPNMGLSQIDLSSLKKAFPFPVFIENEAKCAAFAEFDDSEIEDSLCYISITEGIGGALIIKNKLVNGTHHRAGEIGHLSIDLKGRPCQCGRIGCWEQYASERALLQVLRERGIVFESLEDVFARSRNDSAVRESIIEYAGYIAAGVGNLLLIFDPGAIIIGGSIARFGETLLPLIIDIVASGSRFYKKNELQISFSNLGGDAGLKGAALFPLRNMFA